MNLRHHLLSTTLTTLILTTTACSTVSGHKGADNFADYIWLSLGPDSQQLARVVTAASQCPSIQLDSISQPMTQRAKGNVPDGFSEVLTCETTIPSSVQSASINGTKLALLKQPPQRIIVIGDTGCRMKGSNFQNCNGAQGAAGPAWPFAKMAKVVAAANPDLIVHVGDYHYREAPCPVGNKGCAGSPWGFNWPVWQQDFFKPAAPLLAKAPWVFTRGNHEDCERAWKGWFYFLAPDKLSKQQWQECQLYTPTYGVELGDLTLVSMDSASLPGAYDRSQYQETVDQYGKIYDEVNQLVQGSTQSWVMTHRPIWAISSFNNKKKFGQPDINMSDATMQAGLKASQQGVFDDSVKVLLNGHIHNFETLTFDDNRPSSMVIGDSGTDLSPGISEALMDQNPDIFTELGLKREDFYSATGFAYTLFERQPNQQWLVHMVDIDGQTRVSYRLVGKTLKPL